MTALIFFYFRVKRPGGGLGSVLGKIGKKAKISVLVSYLMKYSAFPTFVLFKLGENGLVPLEAFGDHLDSIPPTGFSGTNTTWPTGLPVLISQYKAF
jgi:hypothetical protein